MEFVFWNVNSISDWEKQNKIKTLLMSLTIPAVIELIEIWSLKSVIKEFCRILGPLWQYTCSSFSSHSRRTVIFWNVTKTVVNSVLNSDVGLFSTRVFLDLTSVNYVEIAEYIQTSISFHDNHYL
eukprot:TRINITY_DN10310_c0_g1_i2.p1 TRINITY_DN10310_c0_g1~~TRINITY_DN10310_c0_g1_i2.p1  ORF type:complete len:125 (+),score=2.14 TRINITY_DN10310_c0_g1_i2:32-406(+)